MQIRDRLTSLAFRFALVLTAGSAVMTLHQGSALASNVGGALTRTEMLQRAQYWVDRGFTYSQSTSAPDSSGRNYRTDCSGLVSNAWHLSSSLVTNQFLSNAQANAAAMQVISLDSLEPGDAVVRDSDGFGPDGHIELFAFWANAADHRQGAYVYSFNEDGETVENPYAASNFGNWGFDSWSELSGYTAIRYTNRIDDSPPPAPVEPVGSQTGDFDGDGKSEVAMFYDYGNDNAGLWLFSSNGTTPRMPWSSGAGNWSVSRTKFVTGDFDGDGRSEIAALYDYGNDSTGLWLFNSDGTSPRRTWVTNPGGWGWNRSKLTAGDFNGDGRAEIAVLYDYSNDVTGLWLFNSDGTSPRRTWVTNPGGWGWNRSKLTVGDFNGDNRSEIAVFYDYSNDNSGLFYFNSAGTVANRVFLSGAGNWGWARSLLGG
jgi:hypothetical protein